MGQLKPSEVRLLVLFFLTVLFLGSFFLYEWYAKSLAEVNSKHLELLAKRQSLLSMKQQQNDYNEKRVWLNQNQPIARDEFEAKEALDRVVSVQGIEAAGLTLMSAPPEKDPRLEPYYWAFERRVIVQGEIQNIVQWLASLQSESSFRAVTHLHIFPKKKKEPETLTCEVTVEQRYATEEILNMTNTVLISSPTEAAPPEMPDPDGGMAPPEGLDGDNSAVATPVTADAPPAAEGKKTRVIVPSRPGPGAAGVPATTPGDPGATPEVTRPRVRLPGPPKTADPETAEDEQAGVNVGTGRGLLANSTRRRVSRGPQPPPPMAADLAAAERLAAETGREVEPVASGIEPIVDAEVDFTLIPQEPLTIRIDSDENPSGPGPREPFDSVSVGGIVGEEWDENTPGAGEPDAESFSEELIDSPTN